MIENGNKEEEIKSVVEKADNSNFGNRSKVVEIVENVPDNTHVGLIGKIVEELNDDGQVSITRKEYNTLVYELYKSDDDYGMEKHLGEYKIRPKSVEFEEVSKDRTDDDEEGQELNVSDVVDDEDKDPLGKVEGARDSEKRKLKDDLIYADAETFKVNNDIPYEYVDVNRERPQLMAHALGYRNTKGDNEEGKLGVILQGEKGMGKTLMMPHLAKDTGSALIQVDCSEGMSEIELIGTHTAKGDDVKYVCGTVPQAIITANEHGRAILVLEEINALRPEMQKKLNEILDFRNGIYVPERAERFQLEDGAELLVVGTMNPSGSGGVFPLNDDFKSRFNIYNMEFPDDDTIKEIVNRNVDTSEFKDEWMDDLLRLKDEIMASDGSDDGVKRTKFNYILSPRDIVKVVESFNIYYDFTESFNSKDSAMSMALYTGVVGKFDNEEHRDLVGQRVFEIFGIMPKP